MQWIHKNSLKRTNPQQMKELPVQWPKPLIVKRSSGRQCSNNMIAFRLDPNGQSSLSLERGLHSILLQMSLHLHHYPSTMETLIKWNVEKDISMLHSTQTDVYYCKQSTCGTNCLYFFSQKEMTMMGPYRC